MAATERVEAQRTPSCPKDRWSTTATKGRKSSDEKKYKNKIETKVSSARWQKTKERKILVFATSDSDGETSIYESIRTKTRQRKGQSAGCN